MSDRVPSRLERIGCARACLQNESARRLFDDLVARYPDCAIFWNCGEEENEVELGFDPRPASSGFKLCGTTLRICGQPDEPTSAA